MPGKPMQVLGIDLGTTNSVIAAVTWDTSASSPIKARCLEVDQETYEGRYTHYLVPSFVAIHNGKTIIGEGAKRLLARSAELGLEQYKNLFFECKNDMGIKRTYHKAPPGFQSAPEIGAWVLRCLYEAVQTEGLTPVDRVVVTVPASFQAQQRDDTLQAASIAGLALAGGDLLDEPVAAFLDYLISYARQPLTKQGEIKNVLLFDFGGGTCDIAIFRLSVDEPEKYLQIAMLAVSRYYRLGGGDIDRAIVYEVLIPQFLKQNDLGKYAVGYDEKKKYLEPVLLGVAEALKISLCVEIARLDSFGKYAGADKSAIVVKQPGIEVTLGKSKLLLQAPSLSAEEYEKLLSPFLDRDLLYARETEYRLTCSVFAPLQDALERSGLSASEIDYVLMVGGSSLIPQVTRACKEFFCKADILTYPDRDSYHVAVARGAAYHALGLATLGRGLVQPICHDSIAIRTEAGLLEAIPKGVPLPYPAGDGYASLDGLAVPASSGAGPVELRVEIVAGAEKRQLFAGIWEINGPVSKEDPLIMECRYDENQVLTFHLSLAKNPGEYFFAALEKPLTNVVNPQQKLLRIYELEEALRTKTIPAARIPDAMVELATDYAELGQYEKAIEFLGNVLKVKNEADDEILNKLAIYCGEIGDVEREEKYYKAAAAVSSWSGSWFNLALAYKRRGKLSEAVEAIEHALALDRSAPYLALRAQLGESSEEVKKYLREALQSFGSVSLLNDWELGWLLTAANMNGDTNRVKEVRAEQERRSKSSSSRLPQGQLPIFKEKTGEEPAQ